MKIFKICFFAIFLWLGFANDSHASLFSWPKPSSGIRIKSLCGLSNDLQSVTMYHQIGEISPSRVFESARWSGKLSTHGRPNTVACSGTLVGPDLFIAAGHCEGTPEESITLDYVDGNNEVHFYDVKEVVKSVSAYGPGDLIGMDFRIYRLKEAIGYKVGWARVSITPLHQDETLFIIQHPNGTTKKVGVGRVMAVDERHIYHNIDTFDASSGSGVLNVRGELVAVHTNGGCESRDDSSNGGVLLSAIFRAYPDVAELLGSF